jgi:hypothetical protein
VIQSHRDSQERCDFQSGRDIQSTCEFYRKCASPECGTIVNAYATSRAAARSNLVASTRKQTSANEGTVNHNAGASHHEDGIHILCAIQESRGDQQTGAVQTGHDIQPECEIYRRYDYQSGNERQRLCGTQWTEAV